MFKRSEQADQWFDRIADKSPFKTIFDQWYVCLIAGLLNGRLDNAPDYKEFTDRFTSDYQSSRRLIIGLLLVAEMHRLEISGNDKVEMQLLMDAVIDPDIESKLTDDGFERLNKYAYGGFCLLRESYPDKPSSPEDFLQFYCQKLEQWDKSPSGGFG